MNKHGLHRHYNNLEPEERFRLDVLATARGDMEESERLTRTCQREIYTMNHRGYTGRWNGTYEITLRMYIAINNELSKLQMIDAFRQLVPYSQTLSHNIAFDAYFKGHEAGSYHAWNAAGKTGRPPAWPEPGWEPDEDERDPAMERDMEELDATVQKYGEFLPELMDKLERDLAERTFSLWSGFVAFCDECVGVAAEKVLAAVLEPAIERIENLKSLAERLELEPDAETVEEVREGLRESWRVVEERGCLVGIKDRLRKLEETAEAETVVARCGGCGEEMRIREDILLDVTCLDWQMHQDDTDELPADTDPDLRWVWDHPCDALLLRDKSSGESVFGHAWERGVRAVRARKAAENGA